MSTIQGVFRIPTATARRAALPITYQVRYVLIFCTVHSGNQEDLLYSLHSAASSGRLQGLQELLADGQVEVDAVLTKVKVLCLNTFIVATIGISVPQIS